MKPPAQDGALKHHYVLPKIARQAQRMSVQELEAVSKVQGMRENNF